MAAARHASKRRGLKARQQLEPELRSTEVMFETKSKSKAGVSGCADPPVIEGSTPHAASSQPHTVPCEPHAPADELVVGSPAAVLERLK